MFIVTTSAVQFFLMYVLGTAVNVKILPFIWCECYTKGYIWYCMTHHIVFILNGARMIFSPKRKPDLTKYML